MLGSSEYANLNENVREIFVVRDPTMVSARFYAVGFG
jgi:hypothetical protein